MKKPDLRFLGPFTAKEDPKSKAARAAAYLRRVPLPFLAIVVVPTVVSAIYLSFIASPRYVSEARFVVRSASQQQPSSLGVVLQGVGLSPASMDNYAIQEYLVSADAARDLQTKFDLRQAFGRAEIDPISRLPGVFGDESFETLRKGLKRYITVGYDSTTGISTLRVQAFTAEDAVRINQILLDSSETLVNRLNERSAADAVRDAEATLREAQARLHTAQAQLTGFRTREGFIDPAAIARESATLIGELSVQLAKLQAERAQIVSTAPDSPQLGSIDSSIAAYQSQIRVEESKLAGRTDSLAPKLSAYETLMLEREFADKLVASATAALNSAQLEARRQQLYLDRIVNPDKPDKAAEPKRLVSLLAIFSSLLLAYGIGWMIWRGVRESRIGE
jgi:capsular polysaccharide transport system permease protein